MIYDPCPNTIYIFRNDFNNTADASDTYPVGITDVTWTITDNSGATNTTCTQTIIVTDDQDPEITACPVTRDITGCSTAAITGPVYSTVSTASTYAVFNDATNLGEGSDNCIFTVSYIDVATGTCPIVVTRTWTLTDASGNFVSCNQVINIDDNTPPVVDCPASFSTPAGFDLGYIDYSIPAFTYNDVCTSPVDIDITWSITGPDATGTTVTVSGSGLIPVPYRFYAGVSTVTYTFADDCGNPATCEFTINVLFPPSITCIPDVEYNTDADACHHTVNPADTDHPGRPTNNTGESLNWFWTIINPDGSTGQTGGPVAGVNAPLIGPYDFLLGESRIEWRAENASGSDECTQLITVIDRTPPTIDATDKEFCVEPLYSAVYNGDADNLVYNPDYPTEDYYLFTIGSTDLDIDPATFDDNCCTSPFVPATTNMRWRIDIDGVYNAATSFEGTGQPSVYVDPVTGNPTDLRIPGDGVNFQDRTHTITYWVTDCNGNESTGETSQIVITPRPQLIKVP